MKSRDRPHDTDVAGFGDWEYDFGAAARTTVAPEMHYHEAKYDESGLLSRECAKCGKDLMHVSHHRTAK
jgi:hypothetical protein